MGRIPSRARFAGLLAWALAAGPVHAATMEVFPYLDEDEGAGLVPLADGREVCATKVARPARDIYDRPTWRFEWPSSATTLSVRGRYEGTHWRTGKRYRHEGEQRWPPVDFAPVGRRLATPRKSYGERMADFVEAANDFAHRQFGPDSESLRTGKPASEADVAAAEARLGYALPRDFVSMLRTTGAVAIGDHGATRVDQIQDADTQRVKGLGYARRSHERPRREAAGRPARQHAAVHGGGRRPGWIALPAPPTRTCGDRPLFRWISQEGRDALLLRADGTCMDFAEAFRRVRDGMLVDGYADALDSEKGGLLLDSSLDTMPLVLRVEPDRFGVSATLRWQGPNGFWRAPAATPAAAAAPAGTGL